MTAKGTLKYRKVERTPQVGKDAGKTKYYAVAVSDRTVEFEDFVSHISDHGSPYSRGCIHGVLMDALDHLQELILDGKSVRLSDLGLFSIGMTSRGEESVAKVNTKSIEGVHLIVRNTKSWSNAELMKKCRIELFDGTTTTENTPDDTGGDNPSQGGSSTPGGSTSGGNTGGSGSEGEGSTSGGGTTKPDGGTTNPGGDDGGGELD